MANGAVYKGDFNFDLPHGQGEMKTEGGTIYRGDFEKGVCSG